MLQRAAIFFVISWLAVALTNNASHARDPVEAFIAGADSIARLGVEAPLTGFVADNSLLVGAAIDQLIDVALTLRDGAQPETERENLDFAERLGRIYVDQAGSRAPLDLVKTYRAWTAGERALRQKAKGLESQANEARAAKDFEKAARLLREANGIYLKIGDRYSEAVIYGSLGVVYWYAGNYAAVLESYEKALAARRAIENRILEGKTLNGLGSTFMVFQRFDEAADYFRQAVELRRKTRDTAGLTTSLTYLGNAYYRTGRLMDARDAYDEALQLLGVAGTPAQRAELLNSIASLYSDMGRLGKSNDAYAQALDIALATEDRRAEISCRMNIAVNLGASVRYREALDEFDRVEQLLNESPDPQQSLLLHQNRGVVNMQIGELERSRDDFLAALRLSREEKAPASEMSALLNLGYLYRELGAYERALAFADSVLTTAAAVKNDAVAHEAHQLAAELERLMGRFDGSLEHWRLALAQDRLEQAEVQALIDETGIANTTAFMGKGEEARGMYRGLLAQARSAGAEDLEETICFGLGHTFEWTNPDSAQCYYEMALAMIEKTRSGLGGAEAGSSYLGGERRYLFEEVARYYTKAARETGEERWSAEAFQTMERAKARGLLDLIEASLSGEHSAAEEAVLDSISRLDPASTEHGAEFRRLETRRERLRNERLDASTSAFIPGGSLADVRDIRKALPGRTAMFVYALGDSASLLWVIDRKGYEVHELPARPALSQDVDLLRSALTLPGSGDAELRRLARKLYRTLIEPGERYLGKNKSLVIVPDGSLFEIPFEILLAGDMAAQTSWRELPFLSRSHAIVYAPSATVYLKLKEQQENRTYMLDMLAVGDPAYAECRGTADRSLRPLPYTRAEIEAIGSYFKEGKKELLLGSNANEVSFKTELRDRKPRLLHIATHGIVDPANPALSSIALCPDAEKREDGYLHTLEITALPIHARLVVLSACESARGRIGRSEGVVGLSRAFIAAGAGGVVSSLWQVSDVSTSKLMQEFYFQMIEKKKPASLALNGARMALLADPKYEHPFYWSPFIVIGSESLPW